MFYVSFIRILFPLRKAFKCTTPNDAFLLEYFNFWLGIISRAILAGHLMADIELRGILETKSYL